MADYPESTKQSVGALVLQIRDLENKLVGLKNQGAELVNPLRAIADLFDPDQRNPVHLVLATDSHFTTTNPPRHAGHRVVIDGQNYPAFSYPQNLRKLLQEILGTQQELRQLEKLLDNAKQRARKVPSHHHQPDNPPTPTKQKPPLSLTAQTALSHPEPTCYIPSREGTEKISSYFCVMMTIYATLEKWLQLRRATVSYGESWP